MTDYPLGKKPASPLNKNKAIMFSDVFDVTKMPKPPKVFGQQKQILNWYNYGNDQFGDCVWAAKAHMHMLWPLLGGYPSDTFWTNNVLSDYAAATGFRADDPNTDQGTDMKSAAEYHRKIGVIDSHGVRHRVSSYVNMTPGDLNQLAVAAFVFGAVELGVLLTQDNMDQFDSGLPWTITRASPIGGHCIPIVGRDAVGNFLCVTWGRIQRIAPAFIKKFMDEGLTYLDQEILNKAGLSPGAYNQDTLQAMLAKVSPQPVVKTVEAQVASLLQDVLSTDTTNREAIRYGFTSAADTPNNVFPTEDQLNVAFKLLRGLLDQSRYGWALSDAKLRPYSDQIAIGVVAAGPHGLQS